MVYPAESPYHNAKTVRALFTAISALEKAEKRKRRKMNLPERAGEPWDEPENALLIKRFEGGAGIDEIAVEHKRTKWAIQSRLEKLGKTAHAGE